MDMNINIIVTAGVREGRSFLLILGFGAMETIDRMSQQAHAFDRSLGLIHSAIDMFITYPTLSID